ncbi:hypothetical protein IW261DRAFT_1421145 [Armillaria novae-zelandiae]|uniref:Uncharacterized protein n=1 Tax=Armillaria novae-zelandiae TaxID=153914 RepID=A0AA39UG45_9AGAR|nr:hypothetical protein IW261DRAFT_1421145 [Armillaria novae-zelandiae]
MDSFNTGTIVLNEVNMARLSHTVSQVELCAKPFTSTVHDNASITHFYLILISSQLWGLWQRLQLDIMCSWQNDVVTPEVTNTHRPGTVIPPPSHLTSLQAIFSNSSPGAGLDNVTVNANNAACGRFCFQALQTFADAGLIEGDWAEEAYEWHTDIGVASEGLGATMIDEDIINL